MTPDKSSGRRAVGHVQRVLIAACCIAVIALPAAGDELPRSMQARGKPEHVLCGISVIGTHDFERYLGPPARTETEPESTEKTLVWVKRGVTLKVALEQAVGTDRPLQYRVYVDVTGSRANGRIGATGQGLRLGDTIGKLQHLYGRRYKMSVTGRTRRVSLQWRDTTWLDVDFGANGRITHMMLSAPE